MTKVKNIHSFPKKLDHRDLNGDLISSQERDLCNEMRETIGELDITFDIGKIEKIIRKVYHNLGSNGVDDKDLAIALAKGDILR